jgi:hypothetical protein
MKRLRSFWIVSGISPLSVIHFCQNHLEINLQNLSLLNKQLYSAMEAQYVRIHREYILGTSNQL